MVRNLALILTLNAALALPLLAQRPPEFVPAGSLVKCTTSEPKISSQTVEIGDPVLCQAGSVAQGGYVIPYGTYLQGRFEEYKDPGHFVGKGWMELRFERMVIPSGVIVPISAKVIHVTGMPVNRLGRIEGKGHPVRDAVLWMIPVLWPIDLINLPRRGPRPTLRAETQMTLKLMDDVNIPAGSPAYAAPGTVSPYGFSTRPPVSSVQPAPAPPAAPPVNYGTAYPAYAPARPAYPPARPAYMAGITMLIMRDGNTRFASQYWLEGAEAVRYIGLNGASILIPIEQLDLSSTLQVNQRRGIGFTLANQNVD